MFSSLTLMTPIHLKKEQGKIPLYYVDPRIIEIFQPRIAACFNQNVHAEMNYLKNNLAAEYFRSHELIAYQFFIENKTANPYRVRQLTEAEFEFIPILSLPWRESPSCSYKRLISDMLKCLEYLEIRNKKLGISHPPQMFMVSSTYNLRTEWGRGMPTQLRKGDAWNKISKFVMDLSIGHYERWPQCPDLLRKSWKYVVELPFVHLPTKQQEQQQQKERKVLFHFSGNFELYGPELVCSVRNQIWDLSVRNDIQVFNVSLSDSRSGVRDSIRRAILNSVFCLVTKGDSYSTSLFYHAIALGCIPVVISDWFVFSFPWLVPYEDFVIRLTETDFLRDPQRCLDHLSHLSVSKPEWLKTVRDKMRQFAPIFSFAPINTNSSGYSQVMVLDKYLSVGKSSPLSFETILPMELLLLELRYSQKSLHFYNSTPCMRPYLCRNLFHKQQLNSFENHQISLGKLSYQVNNLIIPNIVDRRSHLCKHVTRLIGHYRLVFYMQCVRIIWPLQPGTFKPVDNVLKLKTVPKGIDDEEKNFVVNYHNASGPSYWREMNFPISNNTKQIIQLSHIYEV